MLRGRVLFGVPALLMLLAPLPGEAEPIEGVTVARYDLELGFEFNGVVADVPVEPGQHVKAGDVLVKLNTLEQEAQLAQLRIRAESTFEIDSAHAEWELGKIEYERILDAQRQGGATKTEVDRRALEAERDRLTYELFKQRQQEARLQLQQAEANIERYVLRAPRDGIVEQLTVSKGETVREATPVLRFVVVSTLRVEVPTPMRTADLLRVGDEAKVDLDGPGGEEAVRAKVVQVTLVGDPASGLRKVILELPNPQERAAGNPVWVDFEATPASNAATPSNRAPAGNS